MVRISVQVSSGAARFRVMVQAASIERAGDRAPAQPRRGVPGVFPYRTRGLLRHELYPGVETVEEAA